MVPFRAQIDPFGHSATNAALLSAEVRAPRCACAPRGGAHAPPQVGFDALYFARIDYDDRNHRCVRRGGTAAPAPAFGLIVFVMCRAPRCGPRSLAEKAMQLIWRASPSLGAPAQVRARAALSPPAPACADGECRS